LTAWRLKIDGSFTRTQEIPIRRDTCLKSMAALAVTSGLPLSALAATNI